MNDLFATLTAIRASASAVRPRLDAAARDVSEKQRVEADKRAAEAAAVESEAATIVYDVLERAAERRDAEVATNAATRAAAAAELTRHFVVQVDVP